jgi:hypothetical protein
MLTLHIGMPKTATTACQLALSAGRERLAEANIIYPEAFRRPHGDAHHALSDEMLVAESIETETLASFISFLPDYKDQDIIISSEGFTNALAPKRVDVFCDFLKACAAITPTRLIISFRRLDTFFESMYLQSVKVGEIQVSIDSYVGVRRDWAPNLMRGLGQIRDHCGLAGLEAFKYEKGERFQEGFLAALAPGFTGAETFPRRERVNVRLGLKAHTLLLHLPWFCERYDLEMNRGALLREFESGRFTFEDEIHRYTLIDFDQAEARHRDAIAASEATGMTAYADFFGSESIPNAEVSTLDFKRLTARDADSLRAHFAESRRDQAAR